MGPLQARYDGIHRSHTTILGPNVRLGPKVQSPTDRYSLDKAVAAGTSHLYNSLENFLLSTFLEGYILM